MHFDLFTLYLLAVGTLLLNAAMTMWERPARPHRRGQLAVLATGYATLAAGCVAATFRHALPGVSGAALANIVMLSGYLMVLNGVAGLDGRRYRAGSAILIGLVASGWAIAGSRWVEAVWAYGSALPIALVNGATAVLLVRSRAMRGLRSRPLACAMFGIHAIFYAARAGVLPLLVARYGTELLATIATVTMYEGVLYSVGMPMALLALVREEAHGQILRIARTDYLTGLGNRQWFFEEGTRRILSDPGRRPMALLAFDLDHFKTINDRYGHAMGDAVLRSFADIVRTIAGPDAVLARIGGEEFAALLPGCDAPHARATGQAIADRLAGTTVHGRDGIGVTATVSIGLALPERHDDDLAILLSRADHALYLAKKRGRNRIELAPSVGLSAVA